MSVRRPFKYRALEDYLTSSELTVDGTVDDGWGAPLSIKGKEIEAAVLFADVSAFTERTADMTPVETLMFVNHFLTWMTAEALSNGHGIIDKYIGDEVMVVYSREFGSEDPLLEAVRAAVRMARHDVMDFGPHIGIAEGAVIVGYTGTPVRHNCSVFGSPVALAARCAGVPAHVSEEKWVSHTITVLAVSAATLTVEQAVEPDLLRDPETETIEEDDSADMDAGLSSG